MSTIDLVPDGEGDSEDEKRASQTNQRDAQDHMTVDGRLRHFARTLKISNGPDETTTLTARGVRLLESETPEALATAFITLAQGAHGGMGCAPLPSLLALRQLADYFFDSKNFQTFGASTLDIDGVGLKNAVMTANGFVRLIDPGLWVNDECISAFGALLENHFESQPIRTGVFSSYLFTSVTTPKTVRKRIMTHRAFYESCKYLFFPINIDQSHWVLLVVDVTVGGWYFFDSYHAPWAQYAKRHKPLVTIKPILREVLSEIFPAVKQTRGNIVSTRYESTQGDTTSCALYVMHVMECLARGMHLREFERKTWDTESYLLRLHVATALLTGRIDPLVIEPVDVGLRLIQAKVCAFCARPDPPKTCKAWKRYFCDPRVRSCHVQYAEKYGLNYYS
jgi:hypothetical protein